MVTLQICDVPGEVRDALVARARARRQSLQAFLLQLVRRQAQCPDNAELLARFAGREDGLRTSPGEVADVIAEQRRRREDAASTPD